jgi:hypothetical protein
MKHISKTNLSTCLLNAITKTKEDSPRDWSRQYVDRLTFQVHKLQLLIPLLLIRAINKLRHPRRELAFRIQYHGQLFSVVVMFQAQ